MKNKERAQLCSIVTKEINLLIGSTYIDNISFWGNPENGNAAMIVCGETLSNRFKISIDLETLALKGDKNIKTLDILSVTTRDLEVDNE